MSQKGALLLAFLLVVFFSCSLGFGFGYNHGGEIPALFYDALGPSDAEHRHLLASIAELLDLLDPSVVSFLDVIGVGFHRYPGVLIITLHVLFLGVECVAIDIVRLICHQVVLGVL